MRNLYILFIFPIFFLLSSCNADFISYSISEYQSIMYNNDAFINIDIYATAQNSILADFNDNNYYLDIDNKRFKVELLDSDINLLDSYYVYTFYLKIDADLKGKKGTTFFIIETTDNRFKYDIGYLEILDNDYELLSFDELYGIYSYYNDELFLTGINIKINNIPKITKFMIGSLVYGKLDMAIFDYTLPNEINMNDYFYNYSILDQNREMDELIIKNNHIVIPLVYDSLYVIKTGTILIEYANTTYYIDTFDFINNTLNINNYPNSKKEGVVECLN